MKTGDWCIMGTRLGMSPCRLLPRAHVLVLTAAIVAIALTSSGAAPQPGQMPTGIRIEKNIAARMRDGVVLRADVYRPGSPGRYPALLQRTPYSKNDRDSQRRIQRHRLARLRRHRPGHAWPLHL